MRRGGRFSCTAPLAGSSRLAAFLCLLVVLSWVSTIEAQADNLQFDALPTSVDEASGLTPSVRHPGVYWTHNDNINLPASSQRSEPLLFALNARGVLQATLSLSPVRQRDWEAITSGLIDGEPTLIVGDIGDNRNTWPDYRIWFVPEPRDVGGKLSARPTALIRFRYPDQTPQPKRQGGWSGGHDAESMVLDARDRQLLVLTKREKPARFFSIPLDARQALDGDTRLTPQFRHTPVVTAQPIGPLPHLPAPDLLTWLLNPMIGAYADQPTDMALSGNGRLLAVLTYSAVYFFDRPPGASWQQAIARPIDSMALPLIDQWEGISFSVDGKSLLIVREGRGDRTLMHLPLPESLIARE